MDDVTVFSTRRGPLEILTMSASTRGLLANSHLIIGPRECVLVDAQFLLSEARVVADRIAQTGRTLTTIYITHAHPDHYFGLEVLRARFSSARVVALPAVIDGIAATYRDKFAFWAPLYPGDVPAEVTLPAPLTAPRLEVDGFALDVVPVGAAESAHDTVVYVEALQALIAGDLVCNGEHAWLGEQRASEWLAHLAWLEGRFADVDHVLPGHGRPGGRALFAATARYIRDFEGAVREAQAAGGLDAARAAVGFDAARTAMLARYPDHRLPLFLDIGLKRWLGLPL